ncbi:hypothetical protein [Bacillus cytotoxicus]|uniref:hypothetical protein n=1 Tax=Bacillus cytotoxicus TaxID=580165 RepID=UPI003B817F11
MIFLSNIEYINPSHAKVNYVHSMPFDPVYGLGKSEATLMKEGILIESLPVKELIEGKTPVLYVHPYTKKPFYEYEDIVNDNSKQQSEMNRLKQQQVLMQQALDEIIMKNPAPNELVDLKKRLELIQKAIDDLVISTSTLEGGEK